jgi:hypothetical protein
MDIDERLRRSTRPSRKRHHNPLPRTCLEAALGEQERHKAFIYADLRFFSIIQVVHSFSIVVHLQKYAYLQVKRV